MKVSQIKVLYKEEDVNEWFLLNHHLETVGVTMSSRGEGYGSQDFFIIHFKAEAKEVTS